ncbi:unnamed protein product [Didymodactylos carnosus]|uniref:Uncharacterized protein n=2 Tax=Didymodactylos carnosus TaxID=1234261 RepID=A0A8S2IUM6_9BILA|nr:unnamed protein product [Didymodactylos carnosus]CAF3781565.1 unnamed protein product [Didymodactylos carnosus]
MLTSPFGRHSHPRKMRNVVNFSDSMEKAHDTLECRIKHANVGSALNVTQAFFNERNKQQTQSQQETKSALKQ